MSRSATRSISRFVRRLLAAAVALLTVAFLAGSPAVAQSLPSPRAFVSNLDLECFKTSPYTPPSVTVKLKHLNPVLEGMPIEPVTLGAREQLCMPVAKNGVIPPDDVLRYVQWVDLSCYQVSGREAGAVLTLDQLNPVLRNVPRQKVQMIKPEHFCVPVAKNEVIPPPEVLNLVSHIDLLCYGIVPNEPMNWDLLLTQLNPVVRGYIPPIEGSVRYARHLCVPVAKDGDKIPQEAMNILRWVDLEKYDLKMPSMHEVQLRLRHLNPVLSWLPLESAQLVEAQQLAVPVAKNGVFPPAG